MCVLKLPLWQITTQSDVGVREKIEGCRAQNCSGGEEVNGFHSERRAEDGGAPEEFAAGESQEKTSRHHYPFIA